MNFRKMKKIMLVFLILVVFMNIVSANEDACLQEGLSIESDVDSSLIQSVSEDSSTQHCDDIVSVESEPLSSVNSEGMNGGNPVKAENRPHFHVSYRCLNDTIYVDDIIRFEVNVTNDGNTDFDAGEILIRQANFNSYAMEYLDIQIIGFFFKVIICMYI